MANQLVEGQWVHIPADPLDDSRLESRLASIELKLDRIMTFQNELVPFLEMARRYTQGSKTDKLRAILGHGG